MKEIKVCLPVNHQEQPIAVCLGNFDGIHLGHQKLIKKTVEVAKENNLASAFFTFSPNPRKLFSKERINQLTSIDDRKMLVKEFGIDIFLEFVFNEMTMNLTPIEFVEKVLIPLNVKKVICGFDYTFGKFGVGKVDDLMNLGKGYFDVIVIDSFNYMNDKISTTRIMKKLDEGNLEEVKFMLGRDYSLSGKIVKGFSNGHRIGYPTINIDHNDYYLPKNGVYGVYVFVGKRLVKGIGNIGVHPTISQLNKPILEIHLLDFNEEIYGEFVTIKFKKYIRNEKKFVSIDELKKQIKIDTFSDF